MRLLNRTAQARWSATGILYLAVAAAVCTAACAPAGPLPAGPAVSTPEPKPGTQTDRAATTDHMTPADRWPMFRGNPSLSGLSAATLPEPLELLWTFTAPEKKESIESSAAIVDRVVYVGTMGGFLVAIDLDTGKPIWRYSTVPESAGAPGKAPTDLAPAIKSSPAVAAGKVFFGDEVGVFHCVNAADGKRAWLFDTATGAEIVSSATVVGDRVLFGSWDEHLYCLNAADGALLWKFKTGGPVNCTPAVVDGKTFISGCDAQLRVVDISDGSEVASCEMESQTGASPAILGDLLFVGHMGSQVLGIHWKKPEIAWRYQHPERQFEFYSSAAVTPEAVIVGGRDKMVHGIHPQTGESKWTVTTKGRVDSSPAVAGPRAYVGSLDGNLYAIDVHTGEERWRFALGGKISASPAIAAGRLVIGNDEGKLFCFGAGR